MTEIFRRKTQSSISSREFVARILSKIHHFHYWIAGGQQSNVQSLFQIWWKFWDSEGRFSVQWRTWTSGTICLHPGWQKWTGLFWPLWSGSLWIQKWVNFLQFHLLGPFRTLFFGPFLTSCVFFTALVLFRHFSTSFLSCFFYLF